MHCSVHPCLVFCYEGEVGVWVVYNKLKHLVVEDEVRLEQQGVVLLHLLFGECKGVDVVGLVVDGVVYIFYLHFVGIAVANVVDKFLSFVSYNYYYAVQIELC